ncbi:hypothetical protein [Amycolatopsis sp. cmx-4-61]|uniref:hypothetical protein n=1 Tax=Amycolatopsis sp. cmx-4-61 TaxID=2790937 RepID=UPI00397DF86F
MLDTTEGAITTVAAEEGLFLRLFTPASGPDPQNAVATYLTGNISFLDGIAPIGNKFHGVAFLGPESPESRHRRLPPHRLPPLRRVTGR